MQAIQKKAQGNQHVFSRCLCALMAVLLLVSISPFAGAVTKAEIDALKKQQTQLASSKASLQSKLSDLQGSMEQAISKKLLLEEQIDVIRQELALCNNLIAQYDQQIAEKEVELANAQEEEAKYYELFCDRVRSMEETGTVSYWAVLFQANSFSDLLDKLSVIDEIMAYDNEVMDALERARQAVQAAKADLETARAGQQEVKAQLETTQAELTAQQTELDNLVNQMRAQEDQYAEELDAMEANAADLSNDIAAAEKQYQAQIEAARKAAEAAAAAAAQQGSSSSSAAVPGGGNGSAGSGGYKFPLPGSVSNYRITSPFGYRNCPFHGQELHTGTDLSAAKGTNIMATKSGTVLISKYGSSYGNYVVIAHNDGGKSLYAHMSSRAVSAGQSVSQGQVIGYVGSTGSSTGNHLHFEIWTGSSSSSRVNAMQYFR